MCDVFGPPCFARPYQKYEVHRKRNEVYVVGMDKVDKEYSILRIHCPSAVDPNAELELNDGEETFKTSYLAGHLQRLRMSEGGLEKLGEGSGLVGFAKFLQGYYLILITKHRKAGKIGHHYVLCIEDTTLIPLFAETGRGDEKRFKDMFPSLSSKDYYYSYSYDLSRSVQQNLADAIRFKQSGKPGPASRPFYTEKDPLKHHRFVWNHFHMGPFLKREALQRWCLPIIHGFFQNTKCSSSGWTFEVALIARRSRFYAGTRYKKRGLNVDGHVANDVETEQLLCEDSTRHLSRGHVMSFVQMRGSVPLFWSQEATAINPKPPVVYPRCDPTLSATRLHFVDLLERYGTPQLVINLMKAKRQDSYEVRLSKHYESAIERLNREMPADARILYRSFDVKNHAKSTPMNKPIYKVFSDLAASVVSRVGFLHTQKGSYGMPEQTQCGVVRTNCVDCLDRTNVLQFFVGFEVLKNQLFALNLLPEPKLFNESQSQVAFVLSELYDLMGDHLALQYAGSKVHKKYQLLGSRPRMMPTSKEIFTSIHRHYSNSVNDAGRQAAMNLFLGIFQPLKHHRFGEAECDSWVHHKVLRDSYNPGNWWDEPMRAYIENMAAIRGVDPLPIQMPTPADELAWFRVVHRVWKLTWFEKLVSRQESAAVQIHASSTSSVQARAILERSHLKPRPRIRLLLDDEPPLVDPEDESKYKSYADLRQLSRLTWMLDTGDICRAVRDLSQPELAHCQPEALEDMIIRRLEEPTLKTLERLILVSIGHAAPQERLRPRARIQTEKDLRDAAAGGAVESAATRASALKGQLRGRRGDEQGEHGAFEQADKGDRDRSDKAELSEIRARYKKLKSDRPITPELNVKSEGPHIRELDTVDAARYTGKLLAARNPLSRAYSKMHSDGEASRDAFIVSRASRSEPTELSRLGESRTIGASSQAVTESPAPPPPAVHQPAGSPLQLGVKKILCAYCGQLFRHEPQNELRNDRVEHAHLHPLCPEHRRRAKELEAFRESGGFSEQKASPEDTRIGSLVIRVGRTAADKTKPWQGWVNVDVTAIPGMSGIHHQRQTSNLSNGQGDRHHSALARSGTHPSMASQITGPSRFESASGGLSYGMMPGGYSESNSGGSRGANEVYGGHDGMARSGSLGSALRQRPAAVRETSNIAPGAASSHATHLSQAVQARSSADAGRTHGAGVPGMEETHWKHLWSYAFPFSTPSMADVQEFGLPEWWLETLQHPTPSPTTSQGKLDLYKDFIGKDIGDIGGKEKAKKRTRIKKIAVPSDRRLSFLGVPGAVPLQQASSPPMRGGMTMSGLLSPKEPAKSKDSRSIFFSAGTSQVLDEIVAAEAQREDSPSSMMTKRASFIGGHHRARSVM
mmetsp:Transcript_3958/g.13260  ORF Transcript_3958/g.13260 Transcript_3958/m.13260 type:complete len:1368 (+) Transcript_3958:83-4186(+)